MVRRQKRAILWDNEAKLYFKLAIQYIKQESPQGADTVKKAILIQVAALKEDAAIYEIDRFKENNHGSYRALTVYGYRITYQIFDSQILILRMRHSSQNPVLY